MSQHKNYKIWIFSLHSSNELHKILVSVREKKLENEWLL
jgi:hypothetical protein